MGVLSPGKKGEAHLLVSWEGAGFRLLGAKAVLSEAWSADSSLVTQRRVLPSHPWWLQGQD